MYYVYILFSLKDKMLYVGFTKGLKERFNKHTRGEVGLTKYRLPLKLIYYECFVNKQDALAREKYLKSGYGKEQIKSMLKNTLLKYQYKYI